MYLTGITQRDRLFELATRWFSDRLLPGDGRFVTEVFLFENLISGPTGRAFLGDIQRITRPGPIRLFRVYHKDELRRLIAASCTSPTPRMQALLEHYRANPEEFFPRTPVDLILATREDGAIHGMVRIKRIQRTAEKVSRRLADRLAGTIRSAAHALAEHRARNAGIPLESLISGPETMVEEFAAAEQIVSQAFRDMQIRFDPADMRVDDWVGFKFVGTKEELERIEQAIQERPGTTVVAREVHEGRYNDINLLVDLDLYPVGAIIDRMRGQDWSFAAARGLPPATLPREFQAYVETGARTIRAEVILTTFEDLFESEFGLAMHEERVLQQRRNVSYSGRIAKNASYLIEYLLMLAVSPTVEISSLPIKMWGRYLPDVFYLAVWQLFGVTPGEELLDTLAKHYPEISPAGLHLIPSDRNDIVR